MNPGRFHMGACVAAAFMGLLVPDGVAGAVPEDGARQGPARTPAGARQGRGMAGPRPGGKKGNPEARRSGKKPGAAENEEGAEKKNGGEKEERGAGGEGGARGEGGTRGEGKTGGEGGARGEGKTGDEGGARGEGGTKSEGGAKEDKGAIGGQKSAARDKGRPAGAGKGEPGQTGSAARKPGLRAKKPGRSGKKTGRHGFARWKTVELAGVLGLSYLKRETRDQVSRVSGYHEVRISLAPYVGFFVWHGVEVGIYLPVEYTFGRHKDFDESYLKVAFVLAPSYNIWVGTERMFPFVELRLGGGYGRATGEDQLGSYDESGTCLLFGASMGLKIVLAGSFLLRLSVDPGFERQKFDERTLEDGGVGFSIGLAGFL